MDTTFIYALCEPGTGQIRYIGKSNLPENRFKRHLKGSLKADTYLGRWLRVLETQGEKPLLEILDEVPESQWEFWEREYIRVFRAIGMNLVNTSEGGEGVTFTPEVRAKMAAASRGKTPTAETRERMSRGQKNNSPETRAKKRAAHLGVPLSAEHRAKIGAGNTGRKHSPEARERMRESHSNISPETRAKMSISHLGSKWTERQRVAASVRYLHAGNPFFGKKHSDETRAKMKAAWASRKAKKEQS